MPHHAAAIGGRAQATSIIPILPDARPEPLPFGTFESSSAEASAGSLRGLGFAVALGVGADELRPDRREGLLFGHDGHAVARLDLGLW